MLVLVLSSCMPPRPFYDDTQYLQVCGFYAVPTVASDDIKDKSLKVEIKEIDNYNRTLFEFSVLNYATDKREEYVVICQKYDTHYSHQRYVYFYEDICYILKTDDFTEIELLKKKNDWNMPLDETKMSRRKISISYDGMLSKVPYIQEKKVLESVISTGVVNGNITTHHCIDTDGSEHEMLIIQADNDGILTTYYVIADKNYNVSILELTDKELTLDEYVEFKRDNGWIYGW